MKSAFSNGTVYGYIRKWSLSKWRIMIISSSTSVSLKLCWFYDTLKVLPPAPTLFICSFSFAFAPCCLYFPLYHQRFRQHLIASQSGSRPLDAFVNHSSADLFALLSSVLSDEQRVWGEYRWQVVWAPADTDGSVSVSVCSVAQKCWHNMTPAVLNIPSHSPWNQAHSPRSLDCRWTTYKKTTSWDFKSAFGMNVYKTPDVFLS